ncbi:hypothetical protein C8R45DRAFT_945245 [Mycena sanguinolenta]|nr:hypothetical protein C8R45DRAFT_945245 [Mycena sanguinolenta]
MSRDIPLDVFFEIAVILWATAPQDLRHLSQINCLAREAALPVLYRVLCVENGALDHDTLGFPVMSFDAFETSLRDVHHPVTAVKHLHIHAYDFKTDALQHMFKACQRLVTLWIDHDDSVPVPLSLRAMPQLDCLRDLTLPFMYATEGVHSFDDLGLPSVTHLCFSPVDMGSTLHVPMLASFPNLTHLGLTAQPNNDSVQHAVEAYENIGVVVQGTSTYVHNRVVYMKYFVLDMHADWIKRAAASWKPALFGGEDMMDKWEFYDLTMDIRKKEKSRNRRRVEHLAKKCRGF